MYIGVFADKAGAEESNRVAKEWLTTNGYDWFEGDPNVYEGVIDHDVVAAGCGRRSQERIVEWRWSATTMRSAAVSRGRCGPGPTGARRGS